MSTILLIAGWRIYFWSNEDNEPIHIHAEKGDMESKFWLALDNFDLIFIPLYFILNIPYEYYSVN